MILIGNKSDLEDEDKLFLMKLLKKEKIFKIESFETYAKTGEDVGDAFETLFLKF